MGRCMKKVENHCPRVKVWVFTFCFLQGVLLITFNSTLHQYVGKTSEYKRNQSHHQKKEVICFKLNLVATFVTNMNSRKNRVFRNLYRCEQECLLICLRYHALFQAVFIPMTNRVGVSNSKHATHSKNNLLLTLTPKDVLHAHKTIVCRLNREPDFQF